MSAVILNLIKLFGVYRPSMAPGYICDTKCEDPFRCKYIHRMLHIVVITVTVIFIVRQLSFFMHTILFIRVVIFQVHSCDDTPLWLLGVHHPSLHCALQVVPNDDKPEKRRSCGLNCLAFCFLSVLTAINNSSCFCDPQSTNHYHRH